MKIFSRMSERDPNGSVKRFEVNLLASTLEKLLSSLLLAEKECF
jgi:hypothetical protein